MISSLFMRSPWVRLVAILVSGGPGYCVHGSSQLGPDRGLSKDRSWCRVPTRGGTCDEPGFADFRGSTLRARRKCTRAPFAYIAIAKAPCQEFAPLGRIFFPTQNARQCRTGARSILEFSPARGSAPHQR